MSVHRGRSESRHKFTICNTKAYLQQRPCSTCYEKYDTLICRSSPDFVRVCPTSAYELAVSSFWITPVSVQLSLADL